MTFRYPLILQLRSAVSLLLWSLVFSGAVAYWFKGGPPDTYGKVACAVFTVLLAFVVGAVLVQQARLATVIETSEFGLAARRLGRELVSMAWMEVDEVRQIGVLGGFQVRANRTDKAIPVEHRVEGAQRLRAEVASRTGK